MAVNPETRVTNRVRELMESAGAHFIKLSDSFTRGVPDSVVATDRVILIEFKCDRHKRDEVLRTYRSLGLSGAQDHHIRQVYRRTHRGACVLTDSVDGDKMRLWTPIGAWSEGPGHDMYAVQARGWKEIAQWLGLETSLT